MKEKYLINARIIDPKNNLDEIGGLIIDTKLADDINKSVIKEQVELGVAVRMACLKMFCL